MKTINKLFLGLGLMGLSGLYACSDFDEVNTDPSKTPFESLKAYYALNQSFSTIQMDPSTGERMYVYNWAEGARMSVDKGLLVIGGYDDSFISDFYYPCISSAITTANLTISLTETTPDEEVEKKFYPNLKQFARIWRAYLMSQFADNFGPTPLPHSTEDGENPVYSSEKEVYKFILTELKDAVEHIDTNVTPSTEQGACDPYFGYDAAKWLKYGNSLRMRLAMRLSNLETSDPDMYLLAKTEFKAASKDLNLTISENEDIMEIEQNASWNDYTGPYTRSNNQHALSSTFANILTNLGGISVQSQVAGRKNDKLASHIKSEDYLGVKYEKHFVQNTDNPTKDFWMDGIPHNLDPRAMALYYIPGDTAAANFVNISDRGYKNVKYGLIEGENDTIKIENRYTWNGIPAGTSSTYSPSVAKNELFASNTAIANYYPVLGYATRNATEKMVYFGPWETYFLIAEAYEYGWVSQAEVGISQKAAYEKGIELSFEHHGITDGYSDYINSTEYNRVGTSVKFDHTTEATSATMKYVDGYTKEDKSFVYEYPKGSKTLYGGNLNSKLSKIITQKYVAQMPYLVLECWSDFRRLGLPFFEMPANEKSLGGSNDMNDKCWTPEDWKTGQKWSHFPQRLRYPTTLNNSNPTEYKNALGLMGTTENTTMVPLWWSKAAQAQ